MSRKKKDKPEEEFEVTAEMSFVDTIFRRNVFRTTPEELASKWRDVRNNNLAMVKSAVWTDEVAWADLMEHLKFLIENPQPTVLVGYETFNGGINVGFSVDWKNSQVSADGIVLLRGYLPDGTCLAVASAGKYREGFTVTGLKNVRGARLVLIAAQL